VARIRHQAHAALGDLSLAKMHQLTSLYEALFCAREVWSGAANQPRTGYENNDRRVPEIVDDEEGRLFYMMQVVAKEAALRKTVGEQDALERRSILANWVCRAGDDDAWASL
jgi:hypothetical protein